MGYSYKFVRLPVAVYDPRHIGHALDDKLISSLYGFLDSSERAYDVVTYIISNHIGYLLVSKTCVAPLKKITIPRLELYGVTLLAQLMHSLIESLAMKVDTTNMWTYFIVT